ncbi:MAG TPA: toll/interleukin-1 receptor domain-containing protein, partial [Archangium sp.]
MTGPDSLNRSQRPPRYDLFLSYSRADVFLLRQVRQGLAERGLATFLDEDNLEKGEGWGPSLEEALRSTRAVAVFLGPTGLGPWQKKELWVALDLQAS